MNVGQRRSRNIRPLCSLLGYSRQSFYQANKAKERQVLEQELVIQEVLAWRKNQPKVGTRKLYIHLQPFLEEHSIGIGRDALFDLLAERKLLIKKRKRLTPITTNSNHWMHKYPNCIIGFVPTQAHQLLVSDITYIRLCSGGFAYLSLVTDVYSHKIVGYHLSKDLGASGCIKALKMALKQLPAGAWPIHHSDRGCQYCSFDYVQLLTRHSATISMTQDSDPRENAVAERVNGILKEELLSEVFESYFQASTAIAQAVSVYNTIRLHSSISMLTPAMAHNHTGMLERKWKNYYSPKGKEEAMASM
jgi:putative transposase